MCRGLILVHYFYKVAKTVHQHLLLFLKALQVVQGWLAWLYRRLLYKSSESVKHNSEKTPEDVCRRYLEHPLAPLVSNVRCKHRRKSKGCRDVLTTFPVERAEEDSWSESRTKRKIERSVRDWRTIFQCGVCLPRWIMDPASFGKPAWRGLHSQISSFTFTCPPHHTTQLLLST